MTSTTTLRSRAALLLRPLASLALAVALAAPLALDTQASAQFMRNLPSPVSAQQLEGFVKDAGLSDGARAQLLRLHEAYFERFRAFEEQEIDPSLKDATPREFSMTRTVDDARREADLRRRTLQRAAQIDGQLVDEFLGMVGGDDALRAEKLRTALTRRRSMSVMPPFGFTGDAMRFDLRTAPILGTIGESTRLTLAPSFDAYDAELTRLCERFADETIARSVKAAQIREEMGLVSPPVAQPGEPEGAGEDSMRRWFDSMREVQERAAEATNQVVARMRRLHRDTLAQVEPLVSTRESMALRAHLESGLYAGSFTSNRFAETMKRLDAKRKAGEIDDTRWSAVEDAIAANAPTLRALSDATMDAREALPERGVMGMALSLDSNGAAELNPEQARAMETTSRITEADGRAADALLAAAGIAAEEKPDGLAQRPGGIEVGQIGEAVVGSVAIMVNGGDGDAVVLSGEDLEGGIFGMFSGGGPSAPRPMTREQLDLMATRIGLDGGSRPVFDGIVEECAAARAAAEADAGPAAEQIEVGEGGGMAFKITIGPGGEASIGAPDPEKQTALVAAIELAEERMFDALKAAAPADRGDAVERSRRMRARERLLTGERGPVAADLARIVDAAALTETSRAAIAPRLGEWDEASVPALRAMRAELDAVANERKEVESQMAETVDDSGDSTRTVTRSAGFGPDLVEKLQRLDRRGTDARERVATANRAALDAMIDALAGDTAAQKVLRRAYLRAGNPSTYRRMRDMEPFFERALRAVGDDAGARDTVLAIKAELDETREARCERFLTERENAQKGDGQRKNGGNDGGEFVGLGNMQARVRENKQLSEDLGQAEATLFRRLVDFVAATAGAEKAKEIGELPANERKQPSFRFGG